MSFRVEEKITINNTDYLLFKNYLKKIGSKLLYPKRKIFSTYFDNLFFKMYFDTEEGIVPRKKIRIRKYITKNINNSNLETKISSVEGRFKTTKKISKKQYDEFLKNGFFDNQYGICYPVISVAYLREYYSLEGQRITLDTNISYNSFKSKVIVQDIQNCIIEIKGNEKFKKNYFDNLIPFQRIRHSKYLDGLQKLELV